MVMGLVKHMVESNVIAIKERKIGEKLTFLELFAKTAVSGQ